MTLPNLDEALYTKLVATSGVIALVSTKIFNLQAPANTALPYVVFGLASGLPDNSTPHQDYTAIYRIAGWATTLLDAYTIVDAVHNALHKQPFTVSGWSIFQIKEERRNTFIENVDGTQLFRVIGDYRIRASLV